ncbi:hypothetical protein Tco_0858744 [Tanacetum coccineum]|uniref:Reverse transcriptase domain-containing protein n=1 Tax=Tanacetum coccineum TaxID=301880 RepID=A0ABQ5BC56_9ASTR
MQPPCVQNLDPYLLAKIDSDPEEDEEDPEEDPADYPADGGDDDDDDDESFDDDVEEDEDEEEEDHPAPADFVPPPVHRILLPPLPVSSPPLLASPTYPLRYRAAMIRLRAKTLSTSHPLPSSTPPSGTPPLLPIPLPTPSPPFLLPSTVYRAGVFEVTLPPQKRLCISLGLRYEVSESLSAPTARPTGGFRADYGFVGTLDDEIRIHMRYGRLDDAHDDRLLMSGQLNMLCRDICAHARTGRPIETKARLSCEAWAEIGELWAANRRRQAQLVETLTLMRTLQTQVTELQSQQGPASGQAQPEIPEEAGSYNQRFQELALMCARMFPKESDKIEKYVSGLPDMIHGSVMASKPKTMQDAIEFATELMDKKIRTFAKQKSDNKKYQDDNQQQQPNKRQNTGMEYAAGSGEKKPYG